MVKPELLIGVSQGPFYVGCLSVPGQSTGSLPVINSQVNHNGVSWLLLIPWGPSLSLSTSCKAHILGWNVGFLRGPSAGSSALFDHVPARPGRHTKASCHWDPLPGKKSSWSVIKTISVTFDPQEIVHPCHIKSWE